MPRRPLKTAQTPIALPLDDDAIVRLPVVLSVVPIGQTTWEAGIKTGRFPRPVRLTARTRGWRVGAIRAVLASFTDEDDRATNATRNRRR